MLARTFLSFNSPLVLHVKQRRSVVICQRFGQPIVPITSVNNYQTTLRNIPEGPISHLHGGGSLKSCTPLFIARKLWDQF